MYLWQKFPSKFNAAVNYPRCAHSQPTTIPVRLTGILYYNNSWLAQSETDARGCSLAAPKGAGVVDWSGGHPRKGRMLLCRRYTELANVYKLSHSRWHLPVSLLGAAPRVRSRHHEELEK